MMPQASQVVNCEGEVEDLIEKELSEEFLVGDVACGTRAIKH